MAFPAGTAIPVYDTPVAAITQTTAITKESFSAGTLVAVTTTGLLADVVLDVQITGTAPVAGDAFHLYRRALNISSTNDATVPDSAFKNTYVGSFPLDLVTTRQYISLTDIPLTADQEFYVENDTLQSTTGTTVLTVIPKSYGVQA